ncbi:hypothetical protein C8R45DRAFT_1099475 [Mycena sanguinolenta]|nr:hypothetical protein C8R45DRAFT_1099475 [Mycena sanguinolenta]
MRFTILASLALFALAHASPLVTRATPIHTAADFTADFAATSPADRLAFLLSINLANVHSAGGDRTGPGGGEDVAWTGADE